jgi:sialidase-1
MRPSFCFLLNEKLLMTNMWHSIGLLILLSTFCVGIASGEKVSVVQTSTTMEFKTPVFTAGVDGYHTYRIPAIVRAKNGDLLAFAEGRKNGSGDHGDIDIVLKRSGDGGKTWWKMSLVQDEWADPKGRVWIGNPAPVVDVMDPEHPGRIWLPFTRSNAGMFVTYSDDNGETWAERRDVSEDALDANWGWCAAGPVHAIQLQRGKHKGRLVVPCDHQQKDAGTWGSHLVLSDDHGKTWRLGAVDTRPIADPIHPNECVAVELVDGRIYVNTRDHLGSSPATRAVAYSSDGGETFDAPFESEPRITTPVVQNSAIRFAAKDRGDERNVLVYSCPGHAKQRRDLTILLSFDEGATWPVKKLVHEGPVAYSDLIRLDDERVGVLYEAGAKLYGEILFGVLAIHTLSEDAAESLK